MAISVLNTDAGLSGKTIVNAEDAQTITGAKNFDRDPSAPFTVTANSAMVSNLDAEKLGGSTLAQIQAGIWPIGSVFIAVVSTNPATLLGFGTWTAFATGRTLVGIDAGQTEFDTVEETGGTKTHTLTAAELPAHDHDTGYRDIGALGAGANRYLAPTGQGDGQETSAMTSIGSGTAHNNLQPYIVVYMWKRTA